MANTKISALTADSAPTADDLVVTVNDPAGTPATKKATITDFTKAIPAVVGDSGSGGTKGLVPAPGAGDAAAGKFLKADGTFAVPAAGAETGANSDITSMDGLTGALENPSKIVFPEAAAPATPAANKVVLYAKADGLLYSKDDAGAESAVSGTGGGTPGGSDTQVQYNNTGAFAGSANMVFNNGTGRLTVAQLTVSSSASMPATSFSGSITASAGLVTNNDVRFREDFGNQTEYFFQGQTGGTTAQFRAAANRGWHFTSTNDDASAASDTALFRNGAGVVEVNNGTAGTFRDLLARGLRSNAVAFASAIASPVEGTIQAFTDSTTATWGATITGGGTNHVLGYYNGTNWTVVGI